ncbi:MAG TPA: GNAT family N-acetyltransferase [Xanthobacteraceae bacterium]|jgi:L-amino acid N-acyltransferase YncA
MLAAYCEAHLKLHGEQATAGYEIALATRDDIPGILEIQEQNLSERGGALSVRLSAQWFEAVLERMPVVVARRAGQVVGYVASAPLDIMANVPIVAAMLHAYQGLMDPYLYGPICVAESERGRGLAVALFAALRERLPGREGIAFIRRDNAASRRAHAKMGMREVAEYEHDQIPLVVVAYLG